MSFSRAFSRRIVRHRVACDQEMIGARISPDRRSCQAFGRREAGKAGAGKVAGAEWARGALLGGPDQYHHHRTLAESALQHGPFALDRKHARTKMEEIVQSPNQPGDQGAARDLDHMSQAHFQSDATTVYKSWCQGSKDRLVTYALRSCVLRIFVPQDFESLRCVLVTFLV